MDFTSGDTRDCPYYLATRASLSITAELKKAFAAAGVEAVRPAYLGVLMCLWNEDAFDEVLGKLGKRDGVRIAELGLCAGLEPSTMTGVIDRMERDGLVHRADDPRDRRVQNILLTELGTSVRTKVLKAVNATLKESFKGIDEKKIKIAKEVLRQVLINTNRGKIE